MKRFFSYAVVAALMVAAALTVSSCEEEVKYTVRFDSKGGTPTPPEQSVKTGNKVNRPADPIRENYTLTGWATADNEASPLWNFETEPVTGDMTLFARWAIKTYQVAFDSDGGSAVTTQNVAHGSAATKPADPTRNGYAFDGWFVGDAAWNFNAPITAPVTLKAKWTVVHLVTFDSDGGNAISAQTIRNGTTAIRPANPTKTFTPTAGLYAGSINPDALFNFTFVEWRRDGENTAFDFNTPITAPITLKAIWIAPPALTRITAVSANDVPAAFTYVNTYTSNEYTLLLDANVIIGAQNLNSANSKLTINGIGVERFITANSSNGRLFSIDGNNASFTIGRNITLMGKSSLNSTQLIHVQRGSLTMRDGSKITGYNGYGVISSDYMLLVSGINASFKMEGGEISGNRVYTLRSAIVYVTASATFEMSGGSITGNGQNGNDTEVFIDDANCTFRLSGNARIGRLMLYAKNNTTRSNITIVGNYSGTVTSLHLSGYSNASTVATFWTNAPVIVNGTASVISMFNNGGLGNFSTYLGVGGTSIRATHELNAAGVLVLK